MMCNHRPQTLLEKEVSLYHLQDRFEDFALLLHLRGYGLHKPIEMNINGLPINWNIMTSNGIISINRKPGQPEFDWMDETKEYINDKKGKTK